MFVVTVAPHIPARTTEVAGWQWQLCGFMHFALTAIITMAVTAGQDIIQTQYQQVQILVVTVTKPALLEVVLVEVDTLLEAKKGIWNQDLVIKNWQ